MRFPFWRRPYSLSPQQLDAGRVEQDDKEDGKMNKHDRDNIRMLLSLAFGDEVARFRAHGVGEGEHDLAQRQALFVG